MQRDGNNTAPWVVGQGKNGGAIGAQPEIFDSMQGFAIVEQVWAGSSGVNLEELALAQVVKMGGASRVGTFRKHDDWR